MSYQARKTRARRNHGPTRRTERLEVRLAPATKRAIIAAAKSARLPAAQWAERILHAAALAGTQV